MTENGFDIQTISTKRTDKQADRVLLLRQVTIEKEKADPSHFFIISFSQPHIGTFGFAQRRKPTLHQNQKSQFPAHPKKAVVV
jgi:hypothetical protein